MLADAFETTLRRYDPKLSLRRSEGMGCWVIERQAARIHPHEIKLAKHAATVKDATPQACEEYRSLTQGKRALFFADVLDNQTIDRIRLRDLQKRGSAALEENLAQRGKKLDEARKRAHERARAAADIMYHLLNRQQGRIEHEGVANRLTREALGMPSQEMKVRSFPGLVDAFGHSQKPQSRIHLTK